MTKTETSAIKKEIRELKSALSKKQKAKIQLVKKNRSYIRECEKEISREEVSFNRYTADTNNRIAILEGRLNS